MFGSKAKGVFSSRKANKLIVIFTFMIVPLILLLIFTYIPFGKMVSFSFFDMSYTRNKGFVGLDNYIKVFKRKDCFSALRLSLYYMAGSVVQLSLALFLANILSFNIRGRNLFRGLMFFPFLISGIAVGFIFKFFYTHGFVLDTVLTTIGFKLENLPFWLKDQRINNWSLVGTSIWRYFGQNMVLFIGAIMSIDSEMYEAAKLDGATEFQRFRYIILPCIKTIFVLNVIMSISGSLSAFEPPYVITDGANGTGTYFVIMHEIAHTQMKVGLASAMAVVLLLIIFTVTILQNVFFNRIMPSDEVKKDIKNREEQLLLDHPAFINKVMLLLGAGLSLRYAIERIATEYERELKEGGEKHYVYEELCVTMQELHDGVTETQAVESFGRRLKCMPYMRFSSLITQNLRKGAEGILLILEKEAYESMTERKQAALRAGEKAGTKLLFPMILMLGLVMAIIMVPAFMSF